MKFLAAASALLLSLAASARADILIYNGIAPTREIGVLSPFHSDREVFIIDTTNERIQRVHSGHVGRVGVFTVDDAVNAHIVQPLTNRRSYTVVSQADTINGGGANFSTKSLYLRGVNLRVRIAAGKVALYPHVLGGTDRTVVRSDTQVSSTEQSFAVVLNSILTIASNTASDTLADATDRVITALQNAGYKKL